MVFDHDQALLASEGIGRLEELTNSLGITGGTVTGGNRHCLLDYIADQTHFDTWLNRIDGIPSWFIDDICDKAQAYGLSKAQAEFLKGFLKLRRTALSAILKSNADSLPPSDQSDGGLYL